MKEYTIRIRVSKTELDKTLKEIGYQTNETNRKKLVGLLQSSANTIVEGDLDDPHYFIKDGMEDD